MKNWKNLACGLLCLICSRSLAAGPAAGPQEVWEGFVGCKKFVAKEPKNLSVIDQCLAKYLSPTAPPTRLSMLKGWLVAQKEIGPTQKCSAEDVRLSRMFPEARKEVLCFEVPSVSGTVRAQAFFRTENGKIYLHSIFTGAPAREGES